MLDSWGYSSVGRAPALQAGGQEFESPYLHLIIQKALNYHQYLENYTLKKIEDIDLVCENRQRSTMRIKRPHHLR